MAKKYSSKERKAYYMGRAFAAAKAGRCIDLPDEKTKQSFRNGIKSIKDKKPAQTKCISPLYVVNGDGVVLKELNGVKSNG